MRPIRMQPGTVAISIHALREEGDKPPGRPSLPTPYFYPRPPRGGRPINFNTDVLADPISIHALREEGDLRLLGRSLHSFYFYPRPPRGGRLPAPGGGGSYQNFYPRPPRGGRL